MTVHRETQERIVREMNNEKQAQHTPGPWEVCSDGESVMIAHGNCPDDDDCDGRRTLGREITRRKAHNGRSSKESIRTPPHR